jgi:hypothetical protein
LTSGATVDYRFRWTLRPLRPDLRVTASAGPLREKQRAELREERNASWSSLAQGLPGPDDKFVLEITGYAQPFEFSAADTVLIDLHAMEVSWYVTEKTATDPNIRFDGPLEGLLAFEKDTKLILKKKFDPAGSDYALAAALLSDKPDDRPLYLEALGQVQGQLSHLPEGETGETFLPERFAALLRAELAKAGNLPLKGYFEIASEWFLVLKDGSFPADKRDLAKALAPNNKDYTSALDAIHVWTNDEIKTKPTGLKPPERLGRILQKLKTPKEILDAVAQRSDKRVLTGQIREFISERAEARARAGRRAPTPTESKELDNFCRSLLWDFIQNGSHPEPLGKALAKTVSRYYVAARESNERAEIFEPFISALLERDSRTGLSVVGALHERLDPIIQTHLSVVMGCLSGTKVKALRKPLPQPPAEPDVEYERMGRYFGVESGNIRLVPASGQKIAARLKWMRLEGGNYKQIGDTQIGDCVNWYADDFKANGVPIPEKVAKAYVVETGYWELAYDENAPERGERWGYLEGVPADSLPTVPSSLREYLEFKGALIDAMGTVEGAFLVVKKNLGEAQLQEASKLLPASASYQQQLILLSSSQVTKLLRATSGEGQFSFVVENVGGKPLAGSTHPQTAFSSCVIVPSLKPDKPSERPLKASGIVPKNPDDKYNRTGIELSADFNRDTQGVYHVPPIDIRQTFAQVASNTLITEHLDMVGSGIEVVQVGDLGKPALPPDQGLKKLKVAERTIPIGKTLYFWLWAQTAAGDWLGPFPVKRSPADSPFIIDNQADPTQPDPVPVLWRNPPANPPVKPKWEVARSRRERARRANPKYQLTLLEDPQTFQKSVSEYVDENGIQYFDVLVFRRTPDVDINAADLRSAPEAERPRDLEYYMRQPWFAGLIAQGWKYVAGQFAISARASIRAAERAERAWDYKTNIICSSGWDVQAVIIGKRAEADSYRAKPAQEIYLDAVAVKRCTPRDAFPTGVSETPASPMPLDVDLGRSLPQFTEASYLIPSEPPKMPEATADGPGVKLYLRTRPLRTVPGVRTDQVLRLLASAPKQAIKTGQYTLAEFRHDYIEGIWQRTKPEESTPLVEAGKKYLLNWLEKSLTAAEEEKRVPAIEIRGLAGITYPRPEVYDAGLDLPIVGTRVTRVSRETYPDPKRVTVAVRTGNSLTWKRPIDGLILGAKFFVEYKLGAGQGYRRAVFDTPASLFEPQPRLPINPAVFDPPKDRNLLLRVGLVGRYRKDGSAPQGTVRILFPDGVPTGDRQLWRENLVIRVELRDHNLAGDETKPGHGIRSAFAYTTSGDLQTNTTTGAVVGLKSLTLHPLPGGKDIPAEGYAVLAPALKEWSLKNIAHDPLGRPQSGSPDPVWDVLVSGQDDDLCWVMRHLGPGVSQPQGGKVKILPNASYPLLEVKPIHSSITPVTPILGGARCDPWNVTFFIKTIRSQDELIYDDSVRLMGKLMGRKELAQRVSSLREVRSLREILLRILENDWPTDSAEIGKVRAWVRHEEKLLGGLSQDEQRVDVEIPIFGDDGGEGLRPNEDLQLDQSPEFGGYLLSKAFDNAKKAGVRILPEYLHESWVWSIQLQAVENPKEQLFKLASEFTQGEMFYRPLPPLIPKVGEERRERDDDRLLNNVTVELKMPDRTREEIRDYEISYDVAVRRRHKATGPVGSTPQPEFVTLLEERVNWKDVIVVPGGGSKISFPPITDPIAPPDINFEPATYQIAVRQRIKGVLVTSGGEGENVPLTGVRKPADVKVTFEEKGKYELTDLRVQRTSENSLLERMAGGGWSRGRGDTLSYETDVETAFSLPFEYHILGEDEGVYILSLPDELEYSTAVIEGVEGRDGWLVPKRRAKTVTIGFLR